MKDKTSKGELLSQSNLYPIELSCLKELDKKILWLSSWMIHNANNIRENRDGLKVGGHQASCASVSTLMTALYFNILRPNDRVAVKPHASPIFHAIQYLFGKEEKSNIEAFRSLGGAQSYPSRTKDSGGVDFSTGSVGLGVGETLFASLVKLEINISTLQFGYDCLISTHCFLILVDNSSKKLLVHGMHPFLSLFGSS